MNKNVVILGSLFLLLLAAAVLVLQKPGETSNLHESTRILYTIDSSAVDKVEITYPVQSIMLEKRGTGWMVIRPIEYYADQAVVARAIHEIKAMEIKNTISNNREKRAVFQVDSTGVHIVLYEHHTQKADFVLGKMAQNYVESYVRPVNSNDVFVADDISAYAFNRPVKDWRDKTIYSTARENIKSISYQFGDTTFTVNFQDSLWVIGNARAKKTVIEGIVNTLANFQADDFIDSTSSPALKLFAMISCEGTQLRFFFDKISNKYLVQSSRQPQVFVVEPWRANPILKRKKEILEK